MALTPGTRLGPYEILSQIGAGGMGEVYMARDTRLERFVAVKVLPSHLADSPDLRERFEREARTIAKLNHPHICTLHDIGSQDGIDFLVMEYLEGETLAARINKGPLPLDQVLRYAVEVSDALDKAHRAGVTHRDIKPGNIMLVPTTGGGAGGSHGTISVPWASSGNAARTKLLDFGLAKLKQEVAKATIPASEMPTVPGALTEHGTLLGTLHYMAPEQVEGKVNEIDARTDIFAFGALVYEMATGKKAFPGETQASVIAKILEVDPPPMSELQPMTPPVLDRVVKTCFAKDPDERWQTARDVTKQLKWITEGGGQAGAATVVAAIPARPGWRRALPYAVAFVLSVVIGLAAWNLKPSPPQPVTRTVINLPPGQRLAGLGRPAIAISPDGKNLVYVAREGPEAGGSQRLYQRALDSLEAQIIPNTEGAVNPFFSPDGQWVGFFAGGKIQKVSVSGGAAVTLADAPFSEGASWGSGGNLAFAPINTGAIQQVPEEGGAPQPLTQSDQNELSHRWPEWLLEGQAVLFAVSSGSFTDWTNAQIDVQAMETGERRNLVQGGTQPRYVSSLGRQGGHLLYARAGTLTAAPFDARRLELTGAAVPVLEQVMVSTATGAAQYSISSTGTLVYLAGEVGGGQSRMVWVNRNGEEQLLPAAARNYLFPSVSPDGRRVAVGILEQEPHIWVYDTSRDTLTRLTFEGNENSNPTWTPDGERIAFRSDRTGPVNLFWQMANGSGGTEQLTTSEYGPVPSSFSTDGQQLAFMEVHPSTGFDIWALQLSDPSASSGQVRKAQPFLNTSYEETAPVFSPDGHWMAYMSNESGRREIYVQPYPGPGGKWQISTDGGMEPVWNPNGRELFYRSGDTMMAVEVTTQPSFSAGRPRVLFDAGQYLATPLTFPNYDVSPDGQRFLMLKNTEQEHATTQINVVLNWLEELKQRVPVP